jgi:hypothetical protein
MAKPVVEKDQALTAVPKLLGCPWMSSSKMTEASFSKPIESP